MGQQALEGQVETGELLAVRAPGLGQRAGEGRLLVKQLRGPVAHAPGLDQDDEGVGGEEVDEQVLLGRQPGQPGLHAVEDEALAEALPLLAPPRRLTYQTAGPPADLLGGQQLAATEQLDTGQVVGGALVPDRELGETINLVSPQVDPHRRISRRTEHVNDRASNGELAPMLDLVFAPVAHGNQPGHQRRGIDLLAFLHDDRLDVLHVRAQPLQEGPNRGHQNLGKTIRMTLSAAAQPPHGTEPAAHGLHARADPLEGQGLPGGAHLDLLGAEERRQVLGQALGLGEGRDGYERGAPAGGLGDAGDGERPRRLRDSDDPGPEIPEAREGVIAAQQRKEGRQGRASEELRVGGHLTH